LCLEIWTRTPCSGCYEVVAKGGYGGYYAYEYNTAVDSCNPGSSGNLYKLSGAGESSYGRYADEQSTKTETICIEASSSLVRTQGSGGIKGYCAYDDSSSSNSTKAATAGAKSTLKVDGTVVVTTSTGATTSLSGISCNSSTGCGGSTNAWAGTDLYGMWTTGRAGFSNCNISRYIRITSIKR